MFGKKKQNESDEMHEIPSQSHESVAETGTPGIRPFDEIYPNEGDEPEIDEPAKETDAHFTCQGEAFKGDFYEMKRRWIKSMSGLTFLEFCRKNCQQHLL